ncbi:MAG TPA: ATP-binding protein [Thermoplasmata archaeon]|nr:ATP-binding protein [Thermoplasmata archaeon]
MDLFDLAPKESPSALFGRGRELEELCRFVRAGRWVVLLGPRMVGKTSLVKAARHRLGLPGAYVNLWGVNSIKGLTEGLIAGINENVSLRARIAHAIRRVDGFGVGPGGVSVTTAQPKLRGVWDLLNVLGSETRESLVVLDEVQELSSVSGRLLKLLGNIFNTHPRVRFVFTGSLVGLSRTLVEPEARSPLFGRAPVAMTLSPFDPDTAGEFLRRGLRESGRSLTPAELSEVLAGPLDGTPGWLTLFGNHLTVRGWTPIRALAETVREGVRVADEEIGHFLEQRDRRLYWPALRALALRSPWSVVRTYIEQDLGRPVNDATVQRVLRALESSYLARRTEAGYELVDPMVRAFVLQARRPPGRPGARRTGAHR